MLHPARRQQTDRFWTSHRRSTLSLPPAHFMAGTGITSPPFSSAALPRSSGFQAAEDRFGGGPEPVTSIADRARGGHVEAWFSTPGHHSDARWVRQRSRRLEDAALPPLAWLVRTLAFHHSSRILPLGQCSPYNRAPKMIGENASDPAYAYASLSYPADRRSGGIHNDEREDGANALSSTLALYSRDRHSGVHGTEKSTARTSLATVHHAVRQPWQ